MVKHGLYHVIYRVSVESMKKERSTLAVRATSVSRHRSAIQAEPKIDVKRVK